MTADSYKFNLGDRVRKVGEPEVFTVHERRITVFLPLYWIQAGKDFATRTWASEDTLEPASGTAPSVPAADH